MFPSILLALVGRSELRLQKCVWEHVSFCSSSSNVRVQEMQKSWSIFKSPHDMEETMRSLEDVQETCYLMPAWLVCFCYWFISEMGETLFSQLAVYFPWLFAKCCILVMKKSTELLLYG